MTNLVIVAGGLGSRLMPMSNYIPKFLVNIGKNTGYVEQIRYWRREISPHTITVIVHSEYEKLVRAYHQLYFPEVQLIIKTVDEANGSAHAILSTCQHLSGERVLFSWCDVLPSSTIFTSDTMFWIDSSSNVIFTNYDGACRYKLEDNQVKLDSENRGGIFGLYYVGNFRTDVEFKDGQDFVEILNQYGPLAEHEIESIIDFGDVPKLQRVRAKADEAREFNSIEFVGDHVLKTALNEQGKKIIEHEIDWYESLGRLTKNKANKPPTPSAWVSTSKESFFMSRVKGVPIWKAWPDLSPIDRKYVLQQVIGGEQLLFDLDKCPVSRDVIVRDVGIEARDKLLIRFQEIQHVISAFGPVKKVNGVGLQTLDPMATIDALSTKIMSYYEDGRFDYGFIHGDLQFSNSMVDLDTLKVTIIDPRGYFGFSRGTGLQDYDIGKLLYALHGYDTFNQSKTFGITNLKDGCIDFEIPKPSHEGIEDVVESHFRSIHYGWLAVNFIGLAAYIKNDPVKSVCAHYHGLVLAEKWLDTFRT